MEEAIERSVRILNDFMEIRDEDVTLEQKNLAICALAVLCIRKALKDHRISSERALELLENLKSAGFPGIQDLDLSLFREAGSQS